MIELLIVVICIAINGFLAAVEMAFVAVGKPQLRELTRSGSVEAKRILSLREKPERTLSIIQIGITLVGALGAAVGGAGAEETVGPYLQNNFGLAEKTAEAAAIALIVLPITYFSVVIGELVPKTLALRNPLTIVLWSARWLIFFDRTLGPLIHTLEWSTKRFLILFKKSNTLMTKNVSTPNADIADKIGELSAKHKEYVFNLVNLETKKVRDTRVHWKHVSKLDMSLTADEVEQVVLASGHTRLPVVKDETLLEVTGLLHSKQFMAFKKLGKQDWHTIIRPILPLQENDSIMRALRVLQESRSHLAIVYSQNQIVGIVTLEDIIEEIIGEVYDEADDSALKKVLSSSASLRNIGLSQKSPKP